MRNQQEIPNELREYGIIWERLIRQYLLWSAVYVMITRNVNYSKAIATIDAEYYNKCANTGEANILYRPADPLTTEIGPQKRIAQTFDWWLVILLAIVLRWLYKKMKK